MVESFLKMPWENNTRPAQTWDFKQRTRSQEVIPEKLVDYTWQEVASFSTERANREIIEINHKQPEIVTFLIGLTKGMSEEARALPIYLFLVVHRMFQSRRKKVNRVSKEEISERYKYNKGLFETLGLIYDGFSSIQMSRQPYVMKYVLDALAEKDGCEQSVPLSEEHKGFIFLLLKTVVDILDQKSSNH